MRSAQSCVRDALFACVMHAIGGSRMNFVAAAATKFIPHASSCPELTVPGFELVKKGVRAAVTNGDPLLPLRMVARPAGELTAGLFFGGTRNLARRGERPRRGFHPAAFGFQVTALLLRRAMGP